MTVIAVDFTKKAKKQDKDPTWLPGDEDLFSDEMKSEFIEEDKFAELNRKNQERKDRMDRERREANKNVLRSYRIK